MRKYVKQFAAYFLIPLVLWHLRKERKFTYNGITVWVSPGVFHPGFFYSTKFILRYLEELNLSGKSLLELGSGTGLISIAAAKAGAVVTSSDLSSAALTNTQKNALKNQVNLLALRSDLFDDVHGKFDFIIINPPYYAKEVIKESMLAWNCGKNFEYFQKLFFQLPNHIHVSSRVIMVLSKACDLNSIFDIAARYGFLFKLVREKNVLFDEKDYLFEIKTSSAV